LDVCSDDCSDCSCTCGSYTSSGDESDVSCSDEIDNDCDGNTNCEDADCADDPACLVGDADEFCNDECSRVTGCTRGACIDGDSYLFPDCSLVGCQNGGFIVDNGFKPALGCALGGETTDLCASEHGEGYICHCMSLK
jgi:hypothetical protein